MGNARSTIKNKSNRKLCVLTFNEADLLYHQYVNFYTVDLGETKEGECVRVCVCVFLFMMNIYSY